MTLKYTAIVLLLLRSVTAFSQTVVLKGRVINKKSNLTIAGATVKVGTVGTRTNEGGYFTLTSQLKTLTENGVNFTCVGYLGAHLIYEAKHFYDVALVENNAVLKEVVIGAGDDIIKLAIKRIPKNYSNKPIIIRGILRTQSWRNQSEYFKSDAIIKAYIPSYGGSEKTTVAVLQNHIDSVYDKSLRYIRDVSNYNVVDFEDIAHNRFIINKVLKRRKFDYWLIGKQIYNGHKVFIINTILKDSSKRYDKIDATFYIDTATYAFVATNIHVYNWVKLGFLKIKFLNYRVAYEQIGKIWYLAEIHDSFTSAYKKQLPTSTTDFIRTGIDSVNVQPISYKDAIQQLDDVFLIDKHTGKNEWAKNDSLFKEAENKGRVEIIPNTLLDTIKRKNAITNPANCRAKKPFGYKVLDYLYNQGNVRGMYGLTKFPLVINSPFDIVSASVNYGQGASADFRLYKNLFLNGESYTNLWNNKHINMLTKVINVSYDFIFNKDSRNITLTPYTGYEHINISYRKTEVNYNTFGSGLRVSYELTHNVGLTLSSGYNSGKVTTTLYELKIAPTHYEIGFGIVFKP